MPQKYSLRYLPLFEQDLSEAKEYIAVNLQNPVAAENLVRDTKKAIENRLKSPKSFRKYPSKKDRKHPYYRIYVRNYIVFYVVIGDVMEVRRFIYSRRNIEELI